MTRRVVRECARCHHHRPHIARGYCRRAVSCELKPSYWRTAVDNLTRLEEELSRPRLFGEAS